MDRLGVVVPSLLVILAVIIALVMLPFRPEINCKIKTHNYVSKLTVNYTDGKPVKYKQNDKWIFNTLDVTNAEIKYHSEYDKYSDFITEKKAKVIIRQNIITKKIKYNFNEDKLSKENLLLVGKTTSIKDAKESLEKRGYKCE